MNHEKYVVRAGETAHDSYELDLTVERAGWEWSSLRVLKLEPGVPVVVPGGEAEFLVLPLRGGCLVRVGDQSYGVQGRASVFTDNSDH